MGKGDIEAGFRNDQLYPQMLESPQLRWGFIRKVYVIVSVQLLFTSAFSSIFIFYQPARDFARHSEYALWVLLGTLIFTLILLFPLCKWHKKHPVNFVLLGLYTLGMSVSVGFICAFSRGLVILEAAFLTAAVVFSLTLYTFWAVKRGHDFNFLWPFLFAALMVMTLFALIQFVFPLGPTGRMIFAALGALLMCGFIIYDTSNLITIYSYDDYIWAAIAIYGDIITLFTYLLQILDELS